jgi:cell filamentation protein
VNRYACLKRMHRLWLGRIYPWAGKYRQVNVKKDSFSFAAAAQIPKLMAEFEDGPLKRSTPRRSGSIEHLATALAEVHVELVLIHPFREGNGRVARILAVLRGCKRGCRLCTLTSYLVENGSSILPQCALAWTAITNR